MTTKKRRRCGQVVHLANPITAPSCSPKMTPACGSRGSMMVSVAQGDWTAVTCPKCRATLVAGAAVPRR